MTMSDFTGPGRNSEMSMTMSPNVSGPNLPTSSRWPGDSIWKQPSVCVERISRKVASSSSGTCGPVVEVDLLAVHPGDLVDRVRHRGLHPDAQHVELEQAHGLDVVLVELAHREAQPARLDRGAVQQRDVGQHDPARVQRDVPGQRVEPLDVLEQQVEALVPQTAGPQLGQLGDRGAGVARPDVRERLGDGVDLGRRQAERGADVPDGVPHPVGVHHRHAGDPLAAEPRQDLLVDLGAPGRLDVDVDVRQLGAQRRAEPLHQQAVLDRVDAADAEQVVDQAARARAAGRDPHVHVPDQVADRGHGEEVALVAELVDDVELVVEPLLDLTPALAAARHPAYRLGDAGADPLAQHRWPGAGRRTARAPPARAGAPTRCRGRRAGRARTGGPASAVSASSRCTSSWAWWLPPPRVGHDLLGGARHGGAVGQVALGGHPVEVADVEGDQPSGGVQDVGGGGAVGRGVADGVGQDGGQADLAGQGQHPPGVLHAERTVRRAVVADHLDRERALGQRLAPPGQDGTGQVRTPGQHRPPDLAGRAEQHRERRRSPRCRTRCRRNRLRAGRPSPGR